MKYYSMPQKTAPFLKISFQVLHITQYLSYLFRLIFLLNLKLHPAKIITQCQKIWFVNFQRRLLKKILSILKGLNPSTAAGIDNLSGKFLKDVAHVLAQPMSQLCNLSIQLNSFPRSCKIAKVKPVFKKGFKTDPQNYHLISLLSLLSKIIEKIVHDQTEEFLSKIKLLYQFQAGFRKN